VKNGDRIAQCVFTNVIDNSFINMEEVDEISEDTDRGSGGFGHTGVE
jgi:dUTPase